MQHVSYKPWKSIVASAPRDSGGNSVSRRTTARPSHVEMGDPAFQSPHRIAATAPRASPDPLARLMLTNVYDAHVFMETVGTLLALTLVIVNLATPASTARAVTSPASPRHVKTGAFARQETDFPTPARALKVLRVSTAK